MDYLLLIFSLSLSITFLFSGISKIVDIRTSIRITSSVGILPKSFGRFFGSVLPLLEIIIALCLIIGYKTNYMGIISSILLISFIIANFKVIYEGKDLACNCFGNLFKESMGWGGIIHSFILLIFALPVGLFSMNITIFQLQQAMLDLLFILLQAISLFMIGIISRFVEIK
ncbi:MauE/DoxX family redox-associated membrane protein [Brevibacillus brevis]|nr:MauE/DoxX family redox-associated membrane protein [Brevibacillus brevis]